MLVVDSTIVGGEIESHDNGICCIGCDCTTLPDPPLPGAGGPGVVAGTLFVSNSEIRGGEGAWLSSYPTGGPKATFGIPLMCGQQPDGPDVVVGSYQPLYASLAGEPKVAPGDVYVLKSYLGYGGSAPFLFGSLGASAPTLTVAGWSFLDPASLQYLGPAPTGTPVSPGEISFPLPASTMLLGQGLAFQGLNGDLGLTRPVLAIVAP